jgi:hypothetical protein
MFNTVVKHDGAASGGKMGRHKSWRFAKFASLLLVSPDFSQIIHDAHHSVDVVKHHLSLLSQIILNNSLSYHVYNVTS